MLTRVPDRPGAVSQIFTPLAEAAINVDMIIQNVGREKGETDVTFTVPQADLARAQALLEDKREAIGFNRMITDSKVAKITVVGVGMKSHAGVAATMFRALADAADQRPGDLDQRDQGQRADRRGRDRAGGARAAHRLRPRRRGAGRVSAGLCGC